MNPEKAFAKFDTDASGYLDEGEVRAALVEVRPHRFAASLSRAALMLRGRIPA